MAVDRYELVLDRLCVGWRGSCSWLQMGPVGAFLRRRCIARDDALQVDEVVTLMTSRPAQIYADSKNAQDMSASMFELYLALQRFYEYRHCVDHR